MSVGGERGVGGGIAAGGLAATGNMRNDNDDNTLVLDHIPVNVGDLHGGGMGGGRLAGFPSGDAFYDVPATSTHYGGAYPVQHGVLPTIGSDIYHHQQVYYGELNANPLA